MGVHQLRRRSHQEALIREKVVQVGGQARPLAN